MCPIYCNTYSGCFTASDMIQIFTCEPTGFGKSGVPIKKIGFRGTPEPEKSFSIKEQNANSHLNRMPCAI